ncbi:MAG TPA: PspC domain-containing protein [Bacillota bacterium]|nr:PspC domain-containing protein [Bacillota bacterium]
MKRLYRSNRERMLAGVLGGIAEYFNIDPTFVRLLFVAGLFFSVGSFSVFYLIAIFVIPLDPEVY